MLDLLESEILNVVQANTLEDPSVIVVDHGSPNKDVAAVRDRLAEELSHRLVAKNIAKTVQAASMERRPGEEFAFADPLLETALPEVILFVSEELMCEHLSDP